MEKFKTFWDEEQEKKKEIKKNKKLIAIFGRETQLPKKIIHKSLSTGIADPERILKLAGYKNINRGYIKVINSKKRYHAYFHSEKNIIYLHEDEILENGRHKASVVYIFDELQRIKSFVPTTKDNILPREEYVKAMENIKKGDII